MLYTLKWSEKKTLPNGTVLIEAELVDVSGTDCGKATIWRTDKNNVMFPGFDTIMTGMSIEGNLWVSPQGKATLYPPKPQTPNTGPSGASKGGIKAAQERKESSINKSMDRKEESIAFAASFRDATLISITLYKDKDVSDDEFKIRWHSWQEWLYKRFENGMDVTNKPPFE